MVADKAFLGFTTTISSMFLELIEVDDLFTEFARLRSQIALGFMFSKLIFISLKLAVLALNFHMSLLLVIILLYLCHNFSTHSAFVIVSSTPNLVHFKFRHLDLSFAG